MSVSVANLGKKLKCILPARSKLKICFTFCGRSGISVGCVMYTGPYFNLVKCFSIFSYFIDIYINFSHSLPVISVESFERGFFSFNLDI